MKSDFYGDVSLFPEKSLEFINLNLPIHFFPTAFNSLKHLKQKNIKKHLSLIRLLLCSTAFQKRTTKLREQKHVQGLLWDALVFSNKVDCKWAFLKPPDTSQLLVTVVNLVPRLGDYISPTRPTTFYGEPEATIEIEFESSLKIPTAKYKIRTWPISHHAHAVKPLNDPSKLAWRWWTLNQPTDFQKICKNQIRWTWLHFQPPLLI